mmetsp:Transcript_11387/g.15318  ORF Transcript_11387/g.15318 Transcript_11387/m.15318 type:complete len:100 (+) Transcript_11387:774-1073(+)
MSENADRLETHTLDFSADKEISSIEGKHDGFSQILGFSFKDENETEVAKVASGAESSGSTCTWESRPVPKWSSIIGVHGIKDDARHITSLGFILKTIAR